MKNFLPLFILLAACASAPHPRPAESSAAAQPTRADEQPPQLRLPDDVRPRRYTAELNLDPDQPAFHGSATAEVDVLRPTRVVWLNAQDLHVERALATAGGQEQTGEVLEQKKDFVGIRFAQPLPPGPVQLRLDYSGRLSDKDYVGASRQEEDGRWYIFTQFEPIEARRVFPCFDEPSYKISWQLTLVVPQGDRAFSNTPVVSEQPVDAGHTRVTFEQTLPLPSYLVAFAVGPIAVVDAGKARLGGVPVRILVPAGKEEQARFAAQSASEILSRLEAYFGIPYPYPKLDLIAVPYGTGAMENPGLVTFMESLILRPPQDGGIRFRRSFGEVAAHELSHQWFGDLVTTAWWDDLWLNEAFATWMETNIVEGWQPAWHAPELRQRDASQGMSADSLLTARRIRQPIHSDGDMENAFDDITYQKGATVIRMFEQWVGPAVFQRGVRRYLHQYANGNATAQQFLEAISAEAGRDVGRPFSTFLDQPGVPVVTATVDCTGPSPALKLEQERYLRSGSMGTAQTAAQLWQIPVCARWRAGDRSGRDCTLLTGRTGTLPLKAPRCPDWVLGNAGQTGYYRVAYGPDALRTLFGPALAQLSAPEKTGVLGDVVAEVRAGRGSLADALELMPKLARDPNRFVVENAAGLVGMLRWDDLVPAKDGAKYARYVRSLFGPQARALGWTPRQGEDEDTCLLRAALLPLVADPGEDHPLAAEAKRLAERWLSQRQSLDPDMVGPVLAVAAAHGDPALFGKFRAALLKEKDPTDRQRLLGTLGQFRDVASVRSALGLSLSKELDPRDSGWLLWSGVGWPATRALPYEFMKQHYDELVEHLPRYSPAYFPMLGGAQCDERYRPDMVAFFKDRAPKVEGMPRMLEQALEDLDQCVAFRTRQAPAVARFFARQ